MHAQSSRNSYPTPSIFAPVAPDLRNLGLKDLARLLYAAESLSARGCHILVWPPRCPNRSSLAASSSQLPGGSLAGRQPRAAGRRDQNPS